MNVSIKKDPETGELFIDTEDLKTFFENISTIEYYIIEESTDNDIAISFFDKNNNRVYPKNK